MWLHSFAAAAERIVILGCLIAILALALTGCGVARDLPRYW
jgi:hypothetical protein